MRLKFKWNWYWLNVWFFIFILMGVLVFNINKHFPSKIEWKLLAILIYLYSYRQWQIVYNELETVDGGRA